MYKVVLVDDEPFIVEGLTKVIDWARHQFEICGTATSGKRALTLIETNPPDLLITDIKMPDMDGLTLVDHVRKHHPFTRCVILSGHDDFAFVKRGMQLGIDNYLLKPVNRVELQQTLEAVVARIESPLSGANQGTTDRTLLRENVLWRWARGTIGQTELEDRALLLGLDLTGNAYRVGLVLLPIADANLATESWAGSGAWTAPDPAGRVLAVLAGTKEQVDQKAAALVSLVTRHHDACLLLGKTVNRPWDLSQSLTDAEDLARFRLVAPGGRYLDSEGIVRHREGLAIVPPLSVGADDPTTAVRPWLKALATNPQILPEQLQRAAAKVVLDFEGPGNDYAPLLDRLFHAATHDELAEVVEEAIHRHRPTNRGGSSEVSRLIQGVLDWIHGHTSEELSLKTLANRFQVNPTYLGQKFYQETGVHFSPYLTELRIKRARNLLETTHLRAGEIGVSVGFSDPGYFFRIFREHTGQSPTEYRKSKS